MLDEDDADVATELWDTAQATASSVLFYPEGRAALAAAERGRRLTPDGHRRSLAGLEQLRDRLFVVSVDEELAERAGGLAAGLGLRGYDAVHLASALALGPQTTLVTWDRVLGEAAVELGLAVAPAAG